MEELKEIKAKDCVKGEIYMLDLSPYGVFKIQITDISKAEDNTGDTVCLGVKVKDERIPNGTTMISGGTVLKEMNDEYYNNAKKLRKQ
ncbi:MAG: hypothetical protein WC346_18720 [Methanogenium sp.]